MPHPWKPPSQGWGPEKTDLVAGVRANCRWLGLANL